MSGGGVYDLTKLKIPALKTPAHAVPPRAVARQWKSPMVAEKPAAPQVGVEEATLKTKEAMTDVTARLTKLFKETGWLPAWMNLKPVRRDTYPTATVDGVRIECLSIRKGAVRVDVGRETAGGSVPNK